MTRAFLFTVLVTGLLAIVADHLLSPPLRASTGTNEVACAPCGAPCPSTK